MPSGGKAGRRKMMALLRSDSLLSSKRSRSTQTIYYLHWEEFGIGLGIISRGVFIQRFTVVTTIHWKHWVPFQADAIAIRVAMLCVFREPSEFQYIIVIVVVTREAQSSRLNLKFTDVDYTFSQPLKEKCISEVVRIGSISIFRLVLAMKSHVLHTVLCNMSDEAAGEIKVDHSWEWKGWMMKACITDPETGLYTSSKLCVVFVPRPHWFHSKSQFTGPWQTIKGLAKGIFPPIRTHTIHTITIIVMWSNYWKRSPLLHVAITYNPHTLVKTALLTCLTLLTCTHKSMAIFIWKMLRENRPPPSKKNPQSTPSPQRKNQNKRKTA